MNATNNQAFYATAIFPQGHTLGVSIVSTTGAGTTLTRTTSGITEVSSLSVDTSVYGRTMSGLSTNGDYLIVWDNGAGLSATEDLHIVAPSSSGGGVSQPSGPIPYVSGGYPATIASRGGGGADRLGRLLAAGQAATAAGARTASVDSVDGGGVNVTLAGTAITGLSRINSVTAGDVVLLVPVGRGGWLVIGKIT